MIIEKLENWRHVLEGSAWARVFEALERLSPESPDGKTLLAGRDLIMRIMRYETRPIAEAVLEAHREFVDVQMTIAGTERIDWFPAGALEVKTPYDAEKDVMFFHRPGGGLAGNAGTAPPATLAGAQLLLSPGTFCIFFPADAHMPQLVAGAAPEAIKKVVVKVRASLIGKLAAQIQA